MHEPTAACSSSGLPRRLHQLNSHRSVQQRRLSVGPLRRQRRQHQVAANGAIVPNMPFPGDDQASTIFTALSEVPPAGVLENAEDEVAKTADQLAVRLGSGQDASTATDAVAASSANGATPGGPQHKPKVPHRWVIVGAMAAAFVLCNMDKVRTAVVPADEHSRGASFWRSRRASSLQACSSLEMCYYRCAKRETSS